ncbi:MAG TPA: DNA-directed RNA polymerase subunit omega [Terriglobales bacterium]|jgi:DNA-directed RNA polymerase omega subunit
MFGPFTSIEDVPSRYLFMHVVARRARKLQGGARPLLPPSSRKATRIAQQEAMKGLLDFSWVNAPGSEAETESGAEQK